MRPEFSRLIDLRQLGEAPQRIGATREECAALAERFELISVVRLEASVTFAQEGAAILVTGRLRAEVVKLNELSGHADQGELLAWMRPMVKTLKRVFLVHGEPPQMAAMAKAIELAYGLPVTIPARGEKAEL